jgi:hypothetical protein
MGAYRRANALWPHVGRGPRGSRPEASLRAALAGIRESDGAQVKAQEARQARHRLVLVWPDGQETSLSLRTGVAGDLARRDLAAALQDGNCRATAGRERPSARRRCPQRLGGACLRLKGHSLSSAIDARSHGRRFRCRCRGSDRRSDPPRGWVPMDRPLRDLQKSSGGQSRGTAATRQSRHRRRRHHASRPGGCARRGLREMWKLAASAKDRGSPLSMPAPGFDSAAKAGGALRSRNVTRVSHLRPEASLPAPPIAQADPAADARPRPRDFERRSSQRPRRPRAHPARRRRRPRCLGDLVPGAGGQFMVLVIDSCPWRRSGGFSYRQGFPCDRGPRASTCAAAAPGRDALVACFRALAGSSFSRAVAVRSSRIASRQPGRIMPDATSQVSVGVSQTGCRRSELRALGAMRGRSRANDRIDFVRSAEKVRPDPLPGSGRPACRIVHEVGLRPIGSVPRPIGRS